MALFLESLAHIANIGVSIATLLAPAAAGLGALPRAGPLRALVLGASTKLPFLRPSFIASQRTEDRLALAAAAKAQSQSQYVVVTGPKGIGKTTLINTVLAGQPGVLFVNVAAGATVDKIVGDSLKPIARYNFGFLDIYSGAMRVIKWHKRWFGVPPTVVLRVRERAPDKAAADVGGAIRQLVEDYGVHVIVDSSDSSLETMALKTLRQAVVQVEPMGRTMLHAIPELEGLLKALETAGVADLVWEVVGGNPASYDELRRRWVQAGLLGRNDVVKVAEDFMRDQLSTATEVFNDVKAARPDLVAPVYSQFKTVDALPANIRERFTLPAPDKVLRFVKKEGDVTGLLKPATPAMALVLRYSDGGDPPSLHTVRATLTAASAAALSPSSSHDPISQLK